MRPTVHGRYILTGVLLLAGLGVLAHPLWTDHQEAAAQRLLAAQQVQAPTDPPVLAAPASPPSSASSPTAAAPARRGAVYAKLNIPAIGLRTDVVEGASLTDYQNLLELGPAHLQGTALPGQMGNAVIFGHRDEYGSPFLHLYRLVPGDAIWLGNVQYDVSAVWAVTPATLSVLDPAPDTRELTLITCTGPANSLRLIVRAVAAPAAS